jgi:predicted nucleic acid-binding protein
VDVRKQFKSKLIAVDTSLFIYYIEEHPKYFNFVNDLFRGNHEGDFRIVTSVVTLLEVLVLPYKNLRDDLVREYKAIFEQSKGIDLIDLTPEISEISAKLRAAHELRTPDSIEIGTAVYAGADFFLTNDRRLESVEAIPVIVLEKVI